MQIIYLIVAIATTLMTMQINQENGWATLTLLCKVF